MNAVFTIAAKNYLPRARTLEASLKRLHPTIAFHIFLADEFDTPLDEASGSRPVIEARTLRIPHWRDMAFYYDVLELACAIKPFCFRYLIREFGYERIIYLDPDVYVYSSLEPILDALTDSLLMLTPHLTDLSRTTEGATPVSLFLFVGAYNLGFLAVRVCPDVEAALAWWGDRLVDHGFVDEREALHVDQKWMDLIPGLLGDKVLISRDPGHNAAQWNMHERQLTSERGGYFLNGRPLVFFHHTSFDPHNPARLAHRQSKFTLENRPEFSDMMTSYAAELLANGYDRYIGLPHKYSTYENGVKIFAFQRRLYRMVLRSRSVDQSPFAVGPGTFYDLLMRNRLIIPDREKGEYLQADFDGAARWVHLFKRGLLLLKKVIGIKYYHLLIRWLNNNTRPEEQMFLIERNLESFGHGRR